VMMAPLRGHVRTWGQGGQILRRGTMYGVRAPAPCTISIAPLTVWRRFRPRFAQRPRNRDIGRNLRRGVVRGCCRFFETRDPRELERALREPKHRMALVFRWYLGHMASKWPVVGESRRRLDYQIWCGPAMGAPSMIGCADHSWRRKRIVPWCRFALNLLEGAACWRAAQQLRAAGVAVPAQAFTSRPVCWADSFPFHAATRIVHKR